MAPRIKPKAKLPGMAELSPTTTRVRSRAGASGIGAGTGSLLLHILKNFPETQWKQLLVDCVPWLSLAITAGLVWLLTQFNQYVRLKKEKAQLLRWDRGEKYTLGILNDPNASEERKAEARKLLDELQVLRTELARKVIHQTD